MSPVNFKERQGMNIGRIVKAVGSTILAALIGTIILFAVLELICRFVTAPGAPEFYERQIIKNHLSAVKPKGEYRIFMFGESTMHGMQYSPRGTIATWLGEYLKSFLPGKRVKIVNFGRLGEVSAFVLEAAEATRFYKPDLIVVYLGNNDFLPDTRAYDLAVRMNKPISCIKRWLRKSYFMGFLSRLAVKLKWAKKEGGPEKREDIEFERGAQHFGPYEIVPRGSRYYGDIISFYSRNVGSLIAFAKKENIPIILFSPVSNLRLPPHYSLHLKTLAPLEKAEWDKAYKEGIEFFKAGELNMALGQFLDALKIDDTYADLLYRIGTVYDALGSYENAKDFYVRARDYDGAPTRAPSEISSALMVLCEYNDVPLIDTEAILKSRSKGGILSEPIIEDNCHPSLEGQRLMALAVARIMAEKGWLAPAADWQWKNEKTPAEYLKALGIDDHFLAGANLTLTFYLLNLGENNYDRAIQYALRGLQYEPGSVDLVRRLAWLYWLKGDTEKAKEWYLKLGELSPSDLMDVCSRHPEVFK